MVARGLTALTLFAIAWGQQTPPTPNAALVRGQVVDSSSGSPIVGASVTLSTTEWRGAPRRTVTAEQGRFAFEGVVQGNYTIRVNRVGYSPATFQLEKWASSTSGLVSVPAIKLVRYATISGTVLDPPPVGSKLQVHALRFARVSSRAKFDVVSTSEVDSRGRYFLDRLPKGRFVIVVADAKVPSKVATQFYPGVVSIEHATTVSIEPADELGGIDFSVRVADAVSVSGQVGSSPPGRPSMKVALQALGMDGSPTDASPFPTSVTELDTQGRFRFDGIPPGNYVIRGVSFPLWSSEDVGERLLDRSGWPRAAVPLAPTPTEPTYWLEIPVQVGEKPVTGLAASLEPGPKIQGRVVFEDFETVPAAKELASQWLLVRPADGRNLGDAPVARLNEDGSFVTVGLPPGRYSLGALNPHSEWAVDSVKVLGREVGGGDFELRSDVRDVVVTFTPRRSGIGGTVRSSAGLETSATVVAFTTSEAFWGLPPQAMQPRRVMWAASEPGRGFEVTVPSGSYFVIALPDDLAAGWNDPKFLTRIRPQAQRVEVRRGQIVRSDLQLATIK